jgi:hypothetical protein
MNYMLILKPNPRHCWRRAPLLLLLVLAVHGCSQPTVSSKAGESDQTSQDFEKICRLLRDQMLAGDSFPKSLAELRPDLATNLSLFVCESTGSRPGTLPEIEEWTDYIYIGNMPPVIPGAAMLISPPENHSGEAGYVLFAGCTVSRLSPSDVRRLIKDPLCMATNSPPNNVAYVRQLLQIRIPKRLRPYYH